VSAAQPQPEPKPEYTADPALNKPRKVAAEGINPFPQWAEVIKLLQEQDPMLYTYLKKSKGYFDGTRVLIDGGKTFRDFIRANKESQKLIKKLIAQVSGVAVPIGPYESKTVNRASVNAEESLRKLEQLGLEVSIEDSERKKGEPTMKARMPAGFGRPDMNSLMRQAQKMQEDMKAKQAELEAAEYTGSASGEMVTVKMNGKHEVLSITIKPEAVDPDDIEMLEDLVAAAVNATVKQVDETAEAEMGKLTGGLNIPGL